MTKLFNPVSYFHDQPKGKWLEINEIPFEIFYSYWSIYIEKSIVKLHPYDSKYMINE